MKNYRYFESNSDHINGELVMSTTSANTSRTTAASNRITRARSYLSAINETSMAEATVLYDRNDIEIFDCLPESAV